MQHTKKLIEAGLIKPPPFLRDNVHYEVMMGSVAYGVSNDTSDMDVYGWCIPPKDHIFPTDEIRCFDEPKNVFEQYSEHHIKFGQKQYDLTIYNVTKYFKLVMENNPNMIDSLYVPLNCVLHTSKLAQLVLEKRDMFLHKGCYHKFRGYAYKQIQLLKREREGKRQELVDKYGWDTKALYHVARLVDECEQILSLGTLDLSRSKEYLKSIRQGIVTQEEVLAKFTEKEKFLENLYQTSSLPHSPDKEAIRNLLLNVLEDHYGSLSAIVDRSDKYKNIVRQIKELVNDNC